MIMHLKSRGVGGEKLKDDILRVGKDGVQYNEHDLKQGMQYCE